MARLPQEWELAGAFASAHYWLPALARRVALTFAPGEPVSRQDLEECLPRGPWAIVSAANPWSVDLPHGRNRELTGRLAATLAARHLPAEPMHNSAPDGRFAEASFLVHEATRDQALNLCREFGQAAAILGVGPACGLLWTRTGRWVRLPARIVRAY